MIARFLIASAALCSLCACALSDAPRPRTAAIEAPRSTVESIGPGEPEIRIRVARAESKVTASSRTGIDIRGIDPPLYAVRALEVSREQERWAVRADGKRIEVPEDGFTVHPAQSGIIEINGKPLAGKMRFVPATGRTGMDVIEFAPIEIYLTSVLAKELYPGWDLEAYRAQAVAARSYALHERARRRGLGSSYDVESTVQDQAYGGAQTHPRAQAAVLDTRGIILTHAGSVLRAYYSSTCGGRSASARDVWPTHEGFRFNLAAPIQTSPRLGACNASPRYRWRAVRDRDTLSARFRAYAAANGLEFTKMGRISRVSVNERNAHGRPRSYSLRDDQGGLWTIKPEDLRNACNFTDKKLPKPDKDRFVYSGDMGVEIGARSVEINGRGFGHGVGMCQFGAQGLAKDGWTAQRILRHYYPGASIVTVYE